MKDTIYLKSTMGIHQPEVKQELNNSSTDPENVDRNKKDLSGVADIPEICDQSDLAREYRDFPEEKIWSPKDEVNKWVPLYVVMARSVLTFIQETQGISNQEALENSCTGYAEQYITDVLHDSEYSAEAALRTLYTKELPRKLYERWTENDIKLFVKGITRYGKNFTKIRNDLLPQKDMKDIVDFYYAWKRSDSAQQLKICHSRRAKSRQRFSPIDFAFGGESSSKIVTRSVAAKQSLERRETSITPIKNELLHDITSTANSKKELPDNVYTDVRKDTIEVIPDIGSVKDQRKLEENANDARTKRRRNGSLIV